MQPSATVFLLVLVCAVPSALAEVTYSNPLDVEFGDPYVLKASDGTYYMYGTGGVKDGFRACSSLDLVHWNDEGRVYRGNTKDSWATKFFWAPEVYERDGKFYMFYSAQWRENPNNEAENFRIGVAESQSPTGPFKEMHDGPIFDPGYPIIDANVYFAEDGRIYLYYSRCCYKHPVESEIADWARDKGLFSEIDESWIYGVELKPDFSGVIGEPVLLLHPPRTMDGQQAEWESRSVTSGEVNRRWTEGSYLFKNGDTYYMMYSANFYAGKHYAVGYATSRNPLGPFKKSQHNPVLERNDDQGGEVTGTGHNSITWSRDGRHMYCVYHGRTESTGDRRVVFIDPMEINGGKLIVHGPTTSPQVMK